MGNSIFSYLGSIRGATSAAIVAILILALLLIVRHTGFPIWVVIKKMIEAFKKGTGSFVNARETAYQRDLAIGKATEKSQRVKLYRFMNDLIIDLGLKNTGITPYEFLLIICAICAAITIMVCATVFGSWVMFIPFFPIITVGVVCGLYTKANSAHDARIEAIIEAENIICNNIKGGVLLAVKSSMDVIPKEVRTEFRDFIDNVEQKNYHIKTALQELNLQLGSVADDFIKKCIVFELEEEHGIAGMFKDVVEVNNIKMEMRTEMKRRFEEVKHEFIVGAAMILIFLFGVIAIYQDIAYFYFKTGIGNIILAIDALILMSEFVFITYLRAQEL